MLEGMRGKVDKNIPIRLGMSVYRRKHLINAVMGKSQRKIEEGKSIMSKFHDQVESNPEMKPKLMNPKLISDYYVPSLPKRKVVLEPINKRIRTIS